MFQHSRPSTSILPLKSSACSAQIIVPCNSGSGFKRDAYCIEAVQNSLNAGLITADEAEELIFLAHIRLKQRSTCQILRFPQAVRATGDGSHG